MPKGVIESWWQPLDKSIIEGPCQLNGDVTVSGAKNAMLPILAATLLTDQICNIGNVPDLKDTKTILNLLKNLGSHLQFENHHVRIQNHALKSFDVPYDLVKTMRASVLVLGPLLARFGQAKVSLPGGCAIGERPIHLHLMGLKKLGAKIDIQQGYIVAKAKQLKGTRIFFDDVTVNGTQNLMMAAALAKGTTILENAAKEPEVVDLANLLNQMGAKIKGAGSATIRITGVESLTGATYQVMQDRIEAGTLLMAVAAAGGQVKIKMAYAKDLQVVIDKLVSAGVQIECSEDSIWVKSDGNLSKLNIETRPFPGFPTDLQAQMMACLTQAKGTSRIVENIFENRFNHVAELRRMGAQISVDGRCAMIEGGHALTGAPVMATDLRASASLIIAGLVAKGKTTLSRVYHLDRGYERLEEKLQQLGAKIYRQSRIRKEFRDEQRLPVL